MIKYFQRAFTNQANTSENLFLRLSSINSYINQQILVRGRLQKSRIKGNIGFLVLRQQLNTIQCCVVKTDEIDKSVLKYIETIPNESIVDIYGKVNLLSKPTTCSISNYEISVNKLDLVSKSAEVLPFQYEEGLVIDRVSTKVRLDYRFMDLRLPINQQIFLLSSKLCQYFREFLIENGFLEIHTPKIIEGASEGGSEVFYTNYFNTKACLAQSPQLYKQMVILGDFDKVFEIGPVFRAENSNTHRHLCEFTGLDIEMSINSNYFEIIKFVHNLLSDIFTKLEFLNESRNIYQYFNSEKIELSKDLVSLTFEESCSLLKEEGANQEVFQDFSAENEKLLGKIVKKKFFSDFFVVHRYPSNVRPFYTLKCEDDKNFSCSFDFFLRGEEIASGSQRIHNYEELKSSAVQKGIDTKTIENYLEAFKYGAFPHGGCGLGLERLIMLYTGSNNIRLASLFPRDPKRLSP